MPERPEGCYAQKVPDPFSQASQKKETPMPRLTLDKTHSLGKEEAVRRLKEKAQSVKETFGSQVSDLHEEWNNSTISFGFKAMGMKISGTVTADDSVVKMEANLPLTAMMFKGTIEQRIREELDKLLA